MRYFKVLTLVAVAVALFACAKPPQADIDAAKVAVATAAQNADIIAYAPDTLKAAQNKLAQMNTELTAKHYDKVKSLALEAKAIAETAQNDAAKGKKKAQADATALIDSLRKALPDVTRRIAAAHKVKGVKLNFNALSVQLAAAKAAVADAEKDLTDGNFATALQKATAVQAQLASGQKAVEDATAAAKKK